MFFSCKKLTDKILHDLADAIGNQSLHSLQHLSLDLNTVQNISDTGVNTLATAIKDHLKNIQYLRLIFASNGQVTSQMKKSLKERFAYISIFEI